MTDVQLKCNEWRCAQCGHTNKNFLSGCAKCAHEPVLGRWDHDPEGRKYDPDKEEQVND